MSYTSWEGLSPHNRLDQVSRARKPDDDVPLILQAKGHEFPLFLAQRI